MNRVILVLIIANVLFSYKGFVDNIFFDKFKFQIGRIQAGEKLRMLTSGFLHVDWMHLVFNMYALYLFGGIVIRNFQTVHFLLIYIGSLLGGSMYSFYQHRKEYYYSAVGASGAVSGILFSAVMIYPNKMYSFIFFPFIDFPAYVLGIGYLIYSIYGMKKNVGNIGHSAHLGGAIAGFALTILLKPYIVTQAPVVVAVMGAIIAALLLFGNKLSLNK